ncbi:MAG: ATP synthase F0 subunit B [Firmicutes bacterium]|nr:ATP synthase F0 subunit B [Bacillota bacterium]
MNIPLNIDFQQILLHIFNFILLAGGLYFILYKPVRKWMDAREASYQQKREETERLLSEAQTIKEEYTQKMAASDEEIAARKASAEQHILQITEDCNQQLKEREEAMLADARKQAQEEHDKLIYDARHEIAEMVGMAAERLMVGSVSQAYDQFLDNAESLEASGKEQTDESAR